MNGGLNSDFIRGGSGSDLLVGGPDAASDVFEIEFDSGSFFLPVIAVVTGSGADVIRVTGTGGDAAAIAQATLELEETFIGVFSDYTRGLTIY